MRKNLSYLILSLLVLRTCWTEEERSFLDAFLPMFRSIRRILHNAMGENSNTRESRQLLITTNKTQNGLPHPSKFPCDLNVQTRSRTRPTNAHEVRPGDIDVIGTLGDSLTVGFGTTASNLLQVLAENRGQSFSGGGQDDWRTVLTLPNILKIFNPNLIGYSLGTSLSIDKESQFNVAEGGAVSANVPYMAKVLVKRIKVDPRVNVEKDWKMITHMIGDNDFCSEMCYYEDPRVFLSKHRSDLLEVLRILKHNLPRTIVNIIPPPHLRVLTRMHDKPPICHLTHSALCPCVMGMAFSNKRKYFFDLMRKWQELDIEVSNYPEFDSDDFTVIPHRYTLNYHFPRRSNGGVDYSYLSEDCFHFSQKAQARFANDLWNSIMEPLGSKSTDGSDMFTKFRCPTVEHPFIFTRRNSP